jgi:hypothetical protein
MFARCLKRTGEEKFGSPSIDSSESITVVTDCVGNLFAFGVTMIGFSQSVTIIPSLFRKFAAHFVDAWRV